MIQVPTDLGGGPSWQGLSGVMTDKSKSVDKHDKVPKNNNQKILITNGKVYCFHLLSQKQIDEKNPDFKNKRKDNEEPDLF